MEYYVGLDVSLKQTSICVVNQTGSIVQEGVVDSDPEAIASFVRSRAPGTVRIGVAHPTVSQRMTPSDPALAANEQGKLQHLDAMRTPAKLERD